MLVVVVAVYQAWYNAIILAFLVSDYDQLVRFVFRTFGAPWLRVDAAKVRTLKKVPRKNVKFAT